MADNRISHLLIWETRPMELLCGGSFTTEKDRLFGFSGRANVTCDHCLLLMSIADANGIDLHAQGARAAALAVFNKLKEAP